jgi:hypothetical protein
MEASKKTVCGKSLQLTTMRLFYAQVTLVMATTGGGAMVKRDSPVHRSLRQRPSRTRRVDRVCTCHQAAASLRPTAISVRPLLILFSV